MRKLITILALLGLAVSVGAQGARADGVTYTVSSIMYDLDTSATAASAPGASFILVFTVPSTASITNGGVDLTNVSVTFTSSPALPFTGGLAQVMFAAPGTPGFDICIPNCSANDFFDWTFMGPQLFNSSGKFLTGPFMITGGMGFPTPTESFFFDASGATFTGGDLTDGNVSGAAVTTPEPSSMLLLGSGFLALGGFARKRLRARFN
jgi:hypothetical protein